MDNIGDILENLTDDDISQIKNLASSLLGSNGNSNGSNVNNESNANSTNSEGNKIPIADEATMKSIINVMSALKSHSGNDERVSFIASLKPLLSEGRQQKADEAMKMLHLFELLPVIKESGLF